MPYESIETAKKAKFPITAEKAPLTLSQINHLARIYDAIKKAGSADNPMAVAWTQWKELYEKKDDKWVPKEGQKGVSEAFVLSEPEWLPVAKVGQKINYKDGSGGKILTEEALKNAQGTWKGNQILKNHQEAWDDHKILDEKLELPFLYVKVDAPVEAALRSKETTGASIDVDGLGIIGEALANMKGTGLSVLWDRLPACTPEMGCASFDSNSEDYHEGGGKEKMGKEKEEPVTYTGEQTKEMIASAVAEVTEKLDNAHTVAITDLEKANETKIKELGTEHETAIKTAEETAFKRAQARAVFMQKFGLKDDSELMKSYDEVKTVEDMQGLVNSMEIPMAANAAAGISSASGGTSETEKVEILGAWDPAKGEFGKAYRGVI